MRELEYFMGAFTWSLIVVICFAITGFYQVLWLRSAMSQKLSVALDAGRSFRGKRIFGDNKTLRGVIPFVPLCVLMFATMGSLLSIPTANFLSAIDWNLRPQEWSLVGLIAGSGYVLGELPNSFIKRQLDIKPGEMASGRLSKPLLFVVDQVDSVIGVLVALSLFYYVSPLQWLLVLVLGFVVHYAFNVLLYWIGFKSRAG